AVAREKVARSWPGANAYELQWSLGATLEERHSFTGYEGEVCYVQLVHQAVGEEMVPELAAHDDEDLPLASAFELFHFRHSVGDLDDTGGVSPSSQLVLCELVGHYDLLDVPNKLGETPAYGGGVGVVRYPGPVAHVP